MRTRFFITGLLICTCNFSAFAKDLRWDAKWEPQVVQGKSENLQADIKRMWKVVPLPGESFSASPVSAILAAERVFNTVNFTGLTKIEVNSSLKTDLRSPEYGYAAPFYPPPKNCSVFRFDCGNFGWEFYVSYDKKGKATAVTRKWIH